MENIYQVHLTITGDVTGVGYRAWAKRQAEALDVTGWVRNAGAGQVEVAGQGEKTSLEKFISRCHTGPDVAWVEDVAVTWEEPEEEWGEFEIRI